MDRRGRIDHDARRLRLVLVLTAAASFSCATPADPRALDALVADSYRLYGAGDCAALRARIESVDLSKAPPGYQAPFHLLSGFCAERDGEILSAKHRYAGVISEVPRTFLAYEATLRLREIERLEKHGPTREQLRTRAKEASGSPLYRNDAKPLARGLPEYPPGARAAGVEGSVLIDFAITRDGGVTDLVVLESDPPFLFEGAALAAVRDWTFDPSGSDEPRRRLIRFPFNIAPPTGAQAPIATRVDRSELDPIEQRGRDLYEITLASGRARNTLAQAGQLSSLRNFVVVPDANHSLVRFLDDQEQVFADVVVDVHSSEPERVTIHEAPRPLSAEQSEMWKARGAALALAKSRDLKRCTSTYWTAVLPALDPGRSWDVYMLSASSDGRRVPLGGHYRISVSRDPEVPPVLYAFAEACPDPTPPPDSGRLTIAENTSKTPTEAHVFLSLRYECALAVAVRDSGLWYVENGRMRRAEPER